MSRNRVTVPIALDGFTYTPPSSTFTTAFAFGPREPLHRRDRESLIVDTPRPAWFAPPACAPPCALFLARSAASMHCASCGRHFDEHRKTRPLDDDERAAFYRREHL
jgi:hypothetical protein